MAKKRAEITRIASGLHEPSPESLQVEVVWNTALKAQWPAGMKCPTEATSSGLTWFAIVPIPSCLKMPNRIITHNIS
jgi:hypothetical protein